MPPRYVISTATVILLVVLRLNIGWHFFSEGVAHLTDPQWTSEGTLRSAKGPLALFYQAYLPDLHGMDAWLHDRSAEKPDSSVTGFLDELQKDADDLRQQFALWYDLNAAQQKQATRITREHQARMRSWGSGHQDALVAHVHQWQRQEAAREAPDAADVPFRKDRLAGSKAALNGEVGAWRSELAAADRDYENDLAGLLTEEQRETGPRPRPATSIDRVDAVMSYAILAIGALLLLGLLTRTACLAGALFLLSVVSMQPFWVSEALPTYNQFVEMFALLMLASTQVGRWGGLDFFVHNLFIGREPATKGTSDVSDS